MYQKKIEAEFCFEEWLEYMEFNLIDYKAEGLEDDDAEPFVMHLYRKLCETEYWYFKFSNDDILEVYSSRKKYDTIIALMKDYAESTNGGPCTMYSGKIPRTSLFAEMLMAHFE